MKNNITPAIVVTMLVCGCDSEDSSLNSGNVGNGASAGQPGYAGTLQAGTAGNAADGNMWKFDHPPGYLLGNLLGMSDSEIMFAVPKDSDHTRIERLVRLDLTKIDAWSVPEWE